MLSVHEGFCPAEAATAIYQFSNELFAQVLSWTYKTGGALTVTLLIVWPLLALPAKVFPLGYWTFWVILAIIWGLLASVVCIGLPLWEARDALLGITKALVTCSLPKAPSTPEGSMHADPSISAKQAELDMGKMQS
jgi:urea-proton symporter